MSKKTKPAPYVLPEGDAPEWLPLQAWRDYEAARNEGGYPLTAVAVRAALRRLDQFRKHGADIAAVLDLSTQSGWRGLFWEPGRDGVMTNGGMKTSPQAWDEFREAIRTERMPADDKLRRVIGKLGGLWNLGLKTSQQLDMMRNQVFEMLAREAN